MKKERNKDNKNEIKETHKFGTLFKKGQARSNRPQGLL